MGRYQVTVIAGGFDVAVLPDVAVTAGTETAVNVALKIAPARAFVEVNGSAIATEATIRHKVDSDDQARSRNAAELVGNSPGVSLRENGQLASIPFLHGLGDERTKLVVDGMTVSSACPNHMNPPLSYIAPSACGRGHCPGRHYAGQPGRRQPRRNGSGRIPSAGLRRCR